MSTLADSSGAAVLQLSEVSSNSCMLVATERSIKISNNLSSLILCKPVEKKRSVKKSSVSGRIDNEAKL